MSERWRRYYAAAGDAPRDTLLDALARFDAPGAAVDLGCGTGRDTLELLRRGWHVLAIDGEEQAIVTLRERAPRGAPLETQVARFEDATWPDVDLVNASFALPFCEPAAFPGVWADVAKSLRSRGRFSGQLFGERDEWASRGITVQTRAEAEALFAGFELERFDEVEEDGHTAVGEPKHWHLFHVVARKL